jgi:hypothetical protein
MFMKMSTSLHGQMVRLQQRRDEARADDRGMTTETVVITAALAGAAAAGVLLIGYFIDVKVQEIISL